MTEKARPYFFWRCFWHQEAAVAFMCARFDVNPTLQPRSWQLRLLVKVYGTFHGSCLGIASWSRLHADAREQRESGMWPFYFWATLLSVVRELPLTQWEHLVAEAPFEYAERTSRLVYHVPLQVAAE